MLFTEMNLSKSLLNALEDLEYTDATPIQEEAFNPILSGKDVLGIAQTGTGKTFAYLLPILRDLKYSKEGNLRVLVVVPTRELVLQVAGEIEKLTKYSTVRVLGVYGGVNLKTHLREVAEGVDILVATPGRLVDLALARSIKLKTVKKLIIDEVDEMLNLGFRTQLTQIFDLLPSRRQNLMFSATLTEEVAGITDTFFNDPVRIEVAASGTPVDKIEQSAYHIPNYYSKVNLLEHLLQNDEAMDKVLIFAGTKKMADRIFEAFNEKFPEQFGVIHSNKSQNYRIRSVKDFETGNIRVLIATDIIARGLDVHGVSHVINFDTPDVRENYIHRVGRTGRADRTGIAITFVSNGEEEYQMAIEALMKTTIPLKDVPPEVKISSRLLPEEVPTQGGDKNYLPEFDLSKSKGAFHEKKLKNQKVNLADEKRKAFRKAKKNWGGRKGRKKKK